MDIKPTENYQSKQQNKQMKLISTPNPTQTFKTQQLWCFRVYTDL